MFVNLKERKLDYEAANNPSNLITLCKKCHDVADGFVERIGMKGIK